MGTIDQFFQTNLDIVFFVYGMAFLVMGIAIILQPKKLSELSLAREIWLLAMFGLTHGLNELLDMWAIIRGHSAIFDVIRWAMLVSSYVFLFEFGRRLFEADIKNSFFGKLSRYAIPVLGAVVLATAFLSSNFWNTGSNLSRYFLGFPGGLLTGLGLLRYKTGREQSYSGHSSAKYFKWAGGAFLCYAFLGGIVVNPANYFPANTLNTQVFSALTGLPVQVFRALCAMISSYGIVRLLSIFNREAGEKLRVAVENESAAKRDFNDIVSKNADGIVVTDSTGIVCFVNPMAVMLIGRAKDALLGKQLGWELRKGVGFEIKTPPLNGRAGYGEVSVSGTEWAGKPAYLAVIRDITVRKHAEEEKARLEEQLLQSQKMDTVGKLAGGIAHDFNNILGAILGYTDFLIKDLKNMPQQVSDALEVKKAAERAAALTRQLLTFSRKKAAVQKIVDLNDAIKGLLPMLRRLTGENIKLEFSSAERVARIKIDPTHLEQVIINLVVNARDAMPAGGVITVKSEEAIFAAGTVPAGLAAGKYAVFSVSDTGTGMSEEIKKRIFEPFFTTKPEGKGTGLGLSIVYGVIKQNSAQITIDSVLNKGTTFTVYIPATDESETTAAPESQRRDASLKGTETILITEDDDAFRAVLLRILKEQGYNALVASNAGEALSLAKEYTEEIQLLLTDMRMPGKTGAELAEELLKSRPGIRILYMTGYPDTDILDQHHINAEDLLHKPIEFPQLLNKIRGMLDEKSNGRK